MANCRSASERFALVDFSSVFLNKLFSKMKANIMKEVGVRGRFDLNILYVCMYVW